ncbi:alpha/beta hydrolase [Variovorax dokdonensis]|uniref:Alpha/beta hydrolase n=1 Tax=Variovorax dokdonensis TaxID=344883 RepID=A0ABT7NB82_9BURK|nr:alpha/beta hydrolase [Variovorax dokdonensis]MDM0045208.1 alpha/beta hydrolase [Variovorax dokdonensis]
MSPRTPATATDDRIASSANPSQELGEGEREMEVKLPGHEPVLVRLYGERKAAGGPLVLHFHGGTFACGDLDDGRMVARLLAESGAVVASLAYPQKPFPEPIEVGYDMLAWLYKSRVKLAGKDSHMYLAGEEAGGNLAAAVAMIARDRGHPPLAGQLLLSPMLDPCTGSASLREARDADADSPCKWAAGWAKYLGKLADAMHPYAVPGTSLRLSRLAPTLVMVGQDDALRDEGLAYAHRLRSAGNAVTEVVLPSSAGWEDSLAQGASGECPCGLAVKQHLRTFLSAAPPPAD